MTIYRFARAFTLGQIPKKFKTQFFKEVSQALSHFCFPPFCLHCDRFLDEEALLFCKECLDLLEFIDPQERCLYCFSSEVYSKKQVCSFCLKQSHFLRRVGAVFDDFGVARTLLQALRGGRSYLAKGAAGYMGMQWGRLEWPIPDIVVPVPSSFFRYFERGYNPRTLLAKKLSHILGCPMVNILKRVSFETEPAVFGLSGSLFYKKERDMLQDKKILLVDDFLVTGNTFKAAARALLEGGSYEIYGLALCKSF